MITLTQTRDSIAYHLLKAVFVIYFVFVFVLTVSHMALAYSNTKKAVDRELHLIQQSFAEGLSSAYNTAVFLTPPASWQIFFDPKYAHRYGINGTSPGGENVVVAALAPGIPRSDVFDLDKVSTPEVMRKLKMLSDNSKLQWPGAEQGRFYQGIDFGTSWGGGLNEIKAMGEIWKLTVPKEGASGWIDCWAITQHLRDKPKLRLIAEEFINFFISDEKQATVAVRKMTNYPTNWNARRYLTSEEIEDHHIVQPEFLSRLVFLRALPKRDYNGLKLMWRDANAKNLGKMIK